MANMTFWRLLTGLLVLMFSGVFLISCSHPKVTDYANEKPLLNFKEYFTGLVIGHGVITDRFGKVQRRFVVEMRCSWDAQGNGTLDETFRYADGSVQKRLWHVQTLGNGVYSAHADDVIGTASGQEAGNAINFRYVLALPIKQRIWHVDMDDWMFLVDESVLLNRTRMSKWGVHLGDITISFARTAASAAPGENKQPSITAP